MCASHVLENYTLLLMAYKPHIMLCSTLECFNLFFGKPMDEHGHLIVLVCVFLLPVKVCSFCMYIAIHISSCVNILTIVCPFFSVELFAFLMLI